MRKNRNFIHIVDPTSGFVNAPLAEIVKLNLQDKISSASHYSKDRVFLADGADADLFLNLLKERGVENITMEESKCAKESRVRKYPSFRVDGCMENFYELELAKAEKNKGKAAKAAETEEAAPAAEEEPTEVTAQEPAPVNEQEKELMDAMDAADAALAALEEDDEEDEEEVEAEAEAEGEVA